MAYDFDYDYSSDILDDIIDDSINTAYTPPPAADYGAVGDAVGGALSDVASGIINLIAPSVLASQGYNVDGSSALPTLEQLLASGNLSASNIAGVPDSFVLPTEERNLMTEGDFIFPAVNENIFLEELYNYDPNDAFIAEVGVGPGSGYDPRNVGTGSTPTEGTPTEGDQMGPPEPEEKGFFSSLLGALGLGGLMQGGLGGLFGNVLGSMLGGKGSGSPLIDYLMMKSLLKDQGGSGGAVPIGGQAYGGQAFNYQDYQPTNLQPALMPGIAYANVGAPGMMDGGEAKQYPNKGLAALAKEAPEVVKRMGYKDGGSIMNRPGDITFAKLEPGEFVIRREAVDAVGIPTLEQINSMGG